VDGQELNTTAVQGIDLQKVRSFGHPARFAYVVPRGENASTLCLIETLVSFPSDKRGTPSASLLIGPSKIVQQRRLEKRVYDDNPISGLHGRTTSVVIL
jgi:hypothetical protein